LKKFLFLFLITIISNDALAAAIDEETGIRGFFCRISRMISCCGQTVHEDSDASSTAPPITEIRVITPEGFSDLYLAGGSLATNIGSIDEADSAYTEAKGWLKIWIRCIKQKEFNELNSKQSGYTDFLKIAEEEEKAAEKINKLALELSRDEAKKLYTLASFEPKARSSLLVLKIKARF
jgi:hypothetical protein